MLGWIGQPPHEENITGAVGPNDIDKRMISHKWKRFGWPPGRSGSNINSRSRSGFGSFFVDVYERLVNHQANVKRRIRNVGDIGEVGLADHKGLLHAQGNQSVIEV